MKGKILSTTVAVFRDERVKRQGGNVISKTNIRIVSKAKLGNLLRDVMGHICFFSECIDTILN